jgi:hypothetical protein
MTDTAEVQAPACTASPGAADRWEESADVLGSTSPNTLLRGKQEQVAEGSLLLLGLPPWTRTHGVAHRT